MNCAVGVVGDRCRPDAGPCVAGGARPARRRGRGATDGGPLIADTTADRRRRRRASAPAGSTRAGYGVGPAGRVDAVHGHRRAARRGRGRGRFWISPTGFTPVDGAGRPGRRSPLRRRRRLRPADGRAARRRPIPAELGAILATIRAMETGGNYTDVDHDLDGVRRLRLPRQQLGRLRRLRPGQGRPARGAGRQGRRAGHVRSSHRNGGDVSTIPVSWYIGHVPVGAEWDTVPRADGRQPAHAPRVPGPLDEARTPS